MSSAHWKSAQLMFALTISIDDHRLIFPFRALRASAIAFRLARSPGAIAITSYKPTYRYLSDVDERIVYFASFQDWTKQLGSASRAFRPRIWKPDRWRRQRPRPKVLTSLLQSQQIHPRVPVLPRNGDPLRRNAIYAGSPAVSAKGIVRLRERPSQRKHLFIDLGVKP
jgi:hypothetical protein